MTKMKGGNFFAIFTISLIAGLVLIIGLPYAGQLLSSLPTLDLPGSTTKVSSDQKTSTAKNEDKETQAKSNVGMKENEAIELYGFSLPLAISVYNAQNQNRYPATSIESWTAFTSTLSSDYKDPYTGRFPVFTTNSPAKGEVQYISPGTCESKTGKLVKSNVVKSYAFRAKVGEGFLCHSNIAGNILTNK